MAHMHNRFVFILAQQFYHSGFVPFLKDIGYKGSQTGMFLSYLGLVAAVTQAVIIRRLVNTFDENQLQFAMAIAGSVSFWFWSQTSGNLYAVLLILALLTVSANTFLTLNKSCISHSAPNEVAGALMGVQSSVETLARAVGGPAAGYVLENHGGGRAVALVSAGMALYVSGTAMLLSRKQKSGSPPSPSKSKVQ